MEAHILMAMLFPFLCACIEQPYFTCHNDDQCYNYDLDPGRCLQSPQGSFCATPDRSCTSGWRWDWTARGDLSQACIAPSVPLDAGADADERLMTNG